MIRNHHFESLFSTIVEQAADKIISQATDRDIQENALLRKTCAIPAAQKAILNILQAEGAAVITELSNERIEIIEEFRRKRVEAMKEFDILATQALTETNTQLKEGVDHFFLCQLRAMAVVPVMGFVALFLFRRKGTSESS